MKRIIIIGSLLMVPVLGLQTFGQFKSISNVLTGSKQDAEKLFSAYLKPYANAFGADLSGGWYNTAKTHKLGGFDLTFSISAAMVPAADKTYNPSELGLTGTVSGGTTAQTVAGKNMEGPATITYTESGIKVAEFKTPKGTGFGIVPSPMLQLGIGLIKGTDITVRYLPDYSLGNYGAISLWGVGIKHSLKQWIPVIKMTPFFHLAFFGGYTQLKTNYDLNLQPEYYVTQLGATDHTTMVYDNQKLELKAQSLTGNIIASFDFPLVSLYAGAGFCNTNTHLKVTGDFPMATVDGSDLVVEDANRMTNPINIEMKSMQGSKTKPRLNGGVKFKLGFITLHFDYTYANYSVATAGIGLSFR